MKYLAAALICTVSLFAADLKLGKPLKEGDPLPIAKVLASPDQYVGKTVKVIGKITEVCLAMGCWMSLVDDDGHLLRIQVEHEGDIKFPKEAIGKNAIAEGVFEREDLTQEEAIAAAKHEAEENHRAFDASSIRSGKAAYQIAGTGALILQP